VWLVRCRSCRLRAPINYEQLDGSHYLNEERLLRVCGRCGRPLRPETIAAGRWVAGRPDALARGYHVSRLISPGDDMAALVAKHRLRSESEISAHYNFDLGLPYSPRGGSLDRDQVWACRRDWACPTSWNGKGWVTAGVDVGAVLHVRITLHNDNGELVPLFIGEIEDFERLAQLWRGYNVNFGLIDERPEERKAREFCREFAGRAKMIRWSGEDQRDHIVQPDDEALVIARRTWAMDSTVAQVAEQLRLLPRDLPDRYVSQMMAPHRMVDVQERSGKKVARYVSERADHYFFAETHDLLAAECRSGPPVEVRGPAPESPKELARRRRRGLW
jgi:hypothetical protein